MSDAGLCLYLTATDLKPDSKTTNEEYDAAALAASRACEPFERKHSEDDTPSHRLAALFQNGHVYTFSGEAREFVQPLLAEPEARRWQSAMDMASDIVITDFLEMTGLDTAERATERGWYSVPLRQRRHVIYARVARLLSDLYGRCRDSLEKGQDIRHIDGTGVGEIMRSCLSRNFELGVCSVTYPFTREYASVSQFRCFDLRTDPTTDPSPNDLLLLVLHANRP